jgi:hypothetical protein
MLRGFELEQKRESSQERALFYVNRFLGWLLHFLVDWGSKFIKAVINALKMLVHID